MAAPVRAKVGRLGLWQQTSLFEEHAVVERPGRIAPLIRATICRLCGNRRTTLFEQDTEV